MYAHVCTVCVHISAGVHGGQCCTGGCELPSALGAKLWSSARSVRTLNAEPSLQPCMFTFILEPCFTLESAITTLHVCYEALITHVILGRKHCLRYCLLSSQKQRAFNLSTFFVLFLRVYCVPLD